MSDTAEDPAVLPASPTLLPRLPAEGTLPAPADGTLPAPAEGTRRHAGGKSSSTRWAIEWAAIIGVALVLALVIRTVLFQAFFIPSPSMTPTLKVHDRILVNKLAYDFHSIRRGDIVVFKRSPNMANADGNIKDLVKRVIGLPGETIQSTADGHIEINGTIISESYLPPGTLPGPPITKQVIPAGHYFVMGDNRDDSEDSRFFGPIAKSQVIGRAFILIWPLSDFHIFE